ncbi:hypothetical protein [Synechococcus sp. ATX 2A4]|uniref:hypothetical protein n=1 Tax=Synechococcus sp. ATX 2A4 TaxID=2823727 RepID=UPI0020CB94F6|nr:hypothetical protein [Synechococcus sp. ATX 2A4]
MPARRSCWPRPESPGRLRSGSPLADPDALLRPLDDDDLALWEAGALVAPPKP